MSFTDGKRWVAAAEDTKRRWGLDGKGFFCGLCGHRFQDGDGVRWQYGDCRSFKNEEGKTFGVCNFFVCDDCDGGDLLDRWVALHEEFHQPKFRALR